MIVGIVAALIGGLFLGAVYRYWSHVLDHATELAPKTDRSEAIKELLAWNLNWTHPEVDDSFYEWSDEHGYMEKLSDSVRRIPPKGRASAYVSRNGESYGIFGHDIADNVHLEPAKSKRGRCSTCDKPAAIRDKSTGHVGYCYPCFNASGNATQ